MDDCWRKGRAELQCIAGTEEAVLGGIEVRFAVAATDLAVPVDQHRAVVEQTGDHGVALGQAFQGLFDTNDQVGR